MKLIKSKLFWKALGLEFGFLFLFLLIGKFFTSKIYGIIVLMQELGAGLTQYEDVTGETITTEQALALGNIVNQINNSLGQLIFNLIFFILVILVLYIGIKSLEWNLIYNGKLKDFKKYLGKFSILSILLIVILIPFFYLVLVTSRRFLLDYLFNGFFAYNELFKIALLLFVLVLVIYLVFTGYVYLNKYKFLESVIKIFSFKKFKLFFVLVLMFFIFGIIIKYGLSISNSVYGLVIQGVVIAFIGVLYKFYLVEKLKD